MRHSEDINVLIATSNHVGRKYFISIFVEKTLFIYLNSRTYEIVTNLTCNWAFIFCYYNVGKKVQILISWNFRIFGTVKLVQVESFYWVFLCKNTLISSFLRSSRLQLTSGLRSASSHSIIFSWIESTNFVFMKLSNVWNCGASSSCWLLKLLWVFLCKNTLISSFSDRQVLEIYTFSIAFKGLLQDLLFYCRFSGFGLFSIAIGFEK